MIHFILLLVISLLAFLVPTDVSAQTTNDVTSDVTSKIENLGNPAKARWTDANNGCRYARNVWEMFYFNNKLYIGSGNSSNSAPCQNAGPVNVMTYSPSSNTFNNDFVVSEEQISKFVVINNQLIIPGHDPRDDQSLGNWYRLETNGWVKYRNIPKGIHAYDMTLFNNNLFVGVGAAGPAVYMSTNNGQTWVETNTPIGWRTYSLFTLNNKLYSAMTFGGTYDLGLYEYTSGTNFTQLPNITFAKLFPTTPLPTPDVAGMLHITPFGSSIVYIGALNVNDHQWNPFGVFKMSSITSTTTDAAKIVVPNNAKPWDVKIGQDNKLYVLGSIANGSRFWVTVSSSSDLINWKEEFRFDSPTFARTFAIINGDFYFGLGTDTVTLSINSGDILRVKDNALNPTTPPISGPVTPAPTKEGDIIINGAVDIFDYNELLRQFGMTGSDLSADIEKSDTSANKVDIYDFNKLLGLFGS